MRHIALAACVAAAAWTGINAKIKLPQFFTDNMIVQQNSCLTVPGTCAPGAKVTVTTDWEGGTSSAKADKNGRFAADIPTPPAGGPYTMIITDGTDRKVIQNILSGEVWLCSGQSNMEFPAKGWGHLIDEDAVAGTAHHPDIRMLQITKERSAAPQDDAKVNMGGWVMASPATMDISAIAYLFALRMHRELGIPVGVIDSSWGGTMAEAWTGFDSLIGIPGFEEELNALQSTGFTGEGLLEKFASLRDSWYDRARTAARPTLPSATDNNGWKRLKVPSMWEHPDLMDFDGMVWTRTSVNLPASAAGRPLQLHLGAVDDRDETYFNGVKAGEMEGASAQRHYTVPAEAVKAGRNDLTMLVTDFSGPGGLWGDADAICAEDADGNRYPLAGEWQFRKVAPMTQLPPQPFNPETPNYPTLLYNAMIHPLHVMPVKGVLWYQGCSNIGRADQYARLFPALINNWRTLWKQPDMPFYFVQLSGFMQPVNVQPASEWAALRNAQTAALSLPNTAMAVTTDLGNPTDIHPADKHNVADRLARIALARDYGKQIEWAAPSYTSHRIADDKIEITFSAPVEGTTNAITGFIIGDKSGNWAYARAEQTSPTTIRLSSPLVTAPVTARYNWADYPSGNLYSTEAHLPVPPFATDK